MLGWWYGITSALKCRCGSHVWGGNLDLIPGAERVCAVCGKYQRAGYDAGGLLSWYPDGKRENDETPAG